MENGNVHAVMILSLTYSTYKLKHAIVISTPNILNNSAIKDNVSITCLVDLKMQIVTLIKKYVSLHIC